MSIPQKDPKSTYPFPTHGRPIPQGQQSPRVSPVAQQWHSPARVPLCPALLYRSRQKRWKHRPPCVRPGESKVGDSDRGYRSALGNTDPVHRFKGSNPSVCRSMFKGLNMFKLFMYTMYTWCAPSVCRHLQRFRLVSTNKPSGCVVRRRFSRDSAVLEKKIKGT